METLASSEVPALRIPGQQPVRQANSNELTSNSTSTAGKVPVELSGIA